MACLQVKENVRETCTRLIRDIPGIRIGIMAHGDYCDYSNYVLKSLDLTSNVDALVSFVETVPQTGGGDAPEVNPGLFVFQKKLKILQTSGCME